MLADYATIILGTSTRNSEFTEKGDVLILRLKHFKNNEELVFSSNENYTEINEQNKRYLIQEGDIIMAITGSLSLIGNMFQYKLPMKAIISGSLIIIRPKKNPDELYNMLKNKYYHIKTMVTIGGVIPRISTSQIRELEL